MFVLVAIGNQVALYDLMTSEFSEVIESEASNGADSDDSSSENSAPTNGGANGEASCADADAENSAPYSGRSARC